jgi:cell division protein FtsZ
MLVEINESGHSPAILKVIGLGGAGGNAVNRMLESDIRGVHFLAANTDIQALNASSCPNRIQIGAEVTGGLGSGGDPAIGRKAAEEDRDMIRGHLEGADMVFITAGMGGGTGTGASSIVAEVARELGALTVGIVTRPFNFEGRRRMRQAEAGLQQLRECVDTLIIIPNQRLLHVVERNTPFDEALRVADDVLTHATKGISEIITVPGMINVDFADVRTVMRGMGNALMGMGFGQGPDRAREAAQMAISSPLLEDISISGARALLVNFMGGEDMTLAEVDEASNLILEASGEDANVIFGAVIDSRMKDGLRVTLIATGFGGEAAAVAAETTLSEAERVLAAEIRGESDAPPAEVASYEESEPTELPVRIGARVAASTVAQPVAAGATRTAAVGQAGASAPSARGPWRDGIVGAARPMSRPAANRSAPRHPETGRAASPARAMDVTHPPAANTAVAGAEIPQNVVPLVWKKNLRGQQWRPTMSTRWQRVLQRDRLDVPSFLRRRQVD